MEVHTLPGADDHIVLASDRDSGLYIFRYVETCGSRSDSVDRGQRTCAPPGPPAQDGASTGTATSTRLGDLPQGEHVQAPGQLTESLLPRGLLVARVSQCRGGKLRPGHRGGAEAEALEVFTGAGHAPWIGPQNDVRRSAGTDGLGLQYEPIVGDRTDHLLLGSQGGIGDEPDVDAVCALLLDVRICWDHRCIAAGE